MAIRGLKTEMKNGSEGQKKKRKNGSIYPQNQSPPQMLRMLVGPGPDSVRAQTGCWSPTLRRPGSQQVSQAWAGRRGSALEKDPGRIWV